MFLSSSKYYIWNQIESTVSRIDRPQDLEKIVAAIGKVGVASLEFMEMSMI